MKSRYRWYVTFVCFLFLLFHQADKFLISPLVTPIMNEFGINEAQMGAVSSLALLVAGVLFPVWGYLFDRFARPRLLGLASLIWGGTTWLSALAPTWPLFMATRASTGIDDSSYSGIYSLLSDYFEPKVRGKAYGVLQMSGPLGFMLGTVLATMLAGSLGWRNVFVITGGIGVLVAVLMFFTVRERARGQAEPEMAGLDSAEEPRINWKLVGELFRNPSLLLILAQGLFGTFPWSVLTFWFFRYLETERGYSSTEAMLSMIVVIITLAAGYYVGGYFGDLLFLRLKQGRAVVSGIGVLAGAVFLFLTLMVPVGQFWLFAALLGLTGLFMSVASPNVISMTADVTLPEVRSTAQAIRKFFEDGGSAIAPFLAGLIATRVSLHTGILLICISTWVLCAILFAVLARRLPRDIEAISRTLQERADQAAQGAASLQTYSAPLAVTREDKP